MGNYGLAAIEAVELIQSKKIEDPVEAWEISTSEIFGVGTSGQCKGCPKGAFLGLVEEGLIKNINAKKCTRSKKNKAYAIKAIDFLKENPDKNYSELMLWDLVIGDEYKKYNQQMDVVLSLWNSGLIDKR